MKINLAWAFRILLNPYRTKGPNGSKAYSSPVTGPGATRMRDQKQARNEAVQFEFAGFTASLNGQTLTLYRGAAAMCARWAVHDQKVAAEYGAMASARFDGMAQVRSASAARWFSEAREKQGGGL